MKKSLIPICAALAGSIYGVHGAAVDLPASSALPLGSSTTPGFIVRTAQGPALPLLANSSIRAVKQLDGTLTDADGALVANQAVAGPNANGSYTVNIVSFEKDATTFDVVDVASTPLWTFFDPAAFPGIPGTDGHLDNFAAEVVGFLELPAGLTTFGVSVGTDRTDSNDDDSYIAYVAANPRDAFGLKIGEFQRNAPPFQSNTHNENTFQVNAPSAGIYPVRILYWQTSHGANLQFYTVDEASGDRVLVNDLADTRAIKSYTDSSVANANGPYVAEVSPSPGSAGNKSSEPIKAVIVDGAATVATAGVKLYLNNVAVTPQSLMKSGNEILLQYDPNTTRPDVLNTVRLEYADSLGTKRTNSWTFEIVTAGGSATKVAGQWDFDAGDLRATVGRPLAFFTPTAQEKTEFKTTTELGISDINGAPAKVMVVPGDLDRNIGYVMDHGIAPNGGGTRVNQYTLIFDLYIETTGSGAASLLQLSSLANTDDGDLFWQGNNLGQGGGDGYAGHGTLTAGAWHRVAVAYDEAATPPVVTKFVDGIKQDDWTDNQGLDAPRRAMQPTAILFGDGDQDERRTMYVNSIQVRSGKLTDAEMAALGGPAATGIPQTIPASTATGQWDFNYGDLTASIGKDLAYFDPAFDGANGAAEDKTTFGTTTELGIPDIDGVEAKVMRVPGTLDRRIGYVMDHGIAPNGGGTRVNQYTLIFDIYLDTTGAGAASLLQLSSLANTDDGDLFWQGSNFGQGGGDGYAGRGTFTAGAWHRVVAAYDEAATPPTVVKYVDGIKQDEWTDNQGLDAARRAMQPTAILFGDGDQDERRIMYVNSIQVRAGRLSDAEIVELGGPSAAGIPAWVPKSNVTGQWDFEFPDLGATIGADLKYLDPTFDGPDGTSENKTVFGTTTEFGIEDIDGTPAKVVKVPGDLTRQLGYIMEHRIAPNGGGTKVNQYTLIFDIYLDTTGAGAASLLQLSSLANTDDGDLFWQGNNFGQGGGDGYAGLGTFTAGAWHRVIAAYDEAATPPVVTKFVDGIKQDDWTDNQGLDAARRAMQPTAILFGDGDQDERRTMYVSAIQVRSAKLSDAQMEELGGPSAAGIPIALTAAPVIAPPTITITRTGTSITVSWPAEAAGFTLESSPVLPATAWTAVGGVVANSVTIPATTGNLFLRLKQ